MIALLDSTGFFFMKLMMTLYIDETFRNLKKKIHMHCTLSVLRKSAFFERLFFPIRRTGLPKFLTRKIWADKRSYAIWVKKDDLKRLKIIKCQ